MRRERALFLVLLVSALAQLAGSCGGGSGGGSRSVRTVESPDVRCAAQSSPFPPDEGDQSALSDAERRGLDIFLDKGRCINCHNGPEFTKAATHLQGENQEEGLVERMRMGDGGIALYDNGFRTSDRWYLGGAGGG